MELLRMWVGDLIGTIALVRKDNSELWAIEAHGPEMVWEVWGFDLDEIESRANGRAISRGYRELSPAEREPRAARMMASPLAAEQRIRTANPLASGSIELTEPQADHIRAARGRNSRVIDRGTGEGRASLATLQGLQRRGMGELFGPRYRPTGIILNDRAFSALTAHDRALNAAGAR